MELTGSEDAAYDYDEEGCTDSDHANDTSDDDTWVLNAPMQIASEIFQLVAGACLGNIAISGNNTDARPSDVVAESSKPHEDDEFVQPDGAVAGPSHEQRDTVKQPQDTSGWITCDHEPVNTSRCCTVAEFPRFIYTTSESDSDDDAWTVSYHPSDVEAELSLSDHDHGDSGEYCTTIVIASDRLDE